MHNVNTKIALSIYIFTEKGICQYSASKQKHYLCSKDMDFRWTYRRLFENIL